MYREYNFNGTSEQNIRLDKYLSDNIKDLSRSRIKKYILLNQITVNGMPQKAGYVLCANDVVSVNISDEEFEEFLLPEPENMELDIVYEDDDVIVVNKPKGMVVHPAAGNKNHTLVNALLYHTGGKLSNNTDVWRRGIVHRIDKDTSGLLVVAKTDIAQTGLCAQFKLHSIKREYRLLAMGIFQDENIVIDAPIGRHPKNRIKRAVTTEGKRAVTHLTVLEVFKKSTYLKAILETGRTHQIRVHCQYIGHIVLGDVLYGAKPIDKIEGQILHAAKIGFIHPTKNKYMEFESDLPEYFKSVLREERKL